MNSFDVNTLLLLLEHTAHPRSTVESLLQASRELRLPVHVDRRLHELTSSEADEQEVVKQMLLFVRTLAR